MAFEFNKTDALIIVDPQNDFCPGGALAVTDGDRIMKTANALAMLAHRRGASVVITQDWHPSDHKSFARNWYTEPFTEVKTFYGQQTLWPDHCVQGTRGAEFHRDVTGAVQIANLIIRKGMNPEVDSYSAFYENDKVTSTGLAGYLKDRGIERVYLVGLAYDFCVGYSAIDARKAGFEAVVIKDVTRSIDMGGSVETIEAQFQEVGVKLHADEVFA